MSKMKYGLLGLLVIGLLAVGVVSAYGWGSRGQNEDAQAALEANDYDAWVEAVGEDSPMVGVIEEEDFDTLVKLHEVRMEHRQEREQHRDAVMEAIENQDYEAWVEAIDASEGNHRFPHGTSEEDFETIVEMHEDRLNGEFGGCGMQKDFHGARGKGRFS